MFCGVIFLICAAKTYEKMISMSLNQREDYPLYYVKVKLLIFFKNQTLVGCIRAERKTYAKLFE